MMSIHQNKQTTINTHSSRSRYLENLAKAGMVDDCRHITRHHYDQAEGLGKLLLLDRPAVAVVTQEERPQM